jgi:hypothetical protein
MNTLSRDELKRLAEEQAGLCVSIFMPAHRVGPETQQDPIRFRNLLRDAEERLIAEGLRVPDARKLLTPAQKLLADGFFWRHLSDGLAIFLSPNVFRYYRLPLAFQERLVIAPRFYVKPLLPLLCDDGRFYILALSQNAIRLLQGTHFSVSEVRLEHVPANLAEALRDEMPEKELQFRSGAPVGAGQWSTIFYGGGDVSRETKDGILRYCHQIDQGLRELIKERPVPLVLAGVDYLLHIYREASRYPYLIEAEIIGNPDRLSPEDLHARAWEIVQPYFQKQSAGAAARFRQLAGSQRASTYIRTVIPEANRGRVETLFVAAGSELWGTFDPQTSRVAVHPTMQIGDEDLVNLAATRTLLTGGAVYCVAPESMPADAPLAAVFRY